MGLPAVLGLVGVMSRCDERESGEARKPGSPRGLMKQRNTAPAMNTRHTPSITIPLMKAASL